MIDTVLFDNAHVSGYWSGGPLAFYASNPSGVGSVETQISLDGEIWNELGANTSASGIGQGGNVPYLFPAHLRVVASGATYGIHVVLESGEKRFKRSDTKADTTFPGRNPIVGTNVIVGPAKSYKFRNI